MTHRSVILFLAADPVGTDAWQLDRECAAIENELRGTPLRDAFELRSAWAVTVDSLMRHLLDGQPAIVHFAGRGDAAGLVLRDDDGRPRPIAPAALTRMIRSAADRARVAVLNGCYTAVQAEALRDVVGCAIGMRGEVTDTAARLFAVGFYRALGHGRSVGNAYEQAVTMLAARGLAAETEPRCLAGPGVDLEQLRLVATEAATDVATAAVPRATAPASGAVSAPAPGAAQKRYDVFLAHASPDKPIARELYDLLRTDLRTFLDEHSIAPGERWDQVIAQAQRDSRCTVILLSLNTDRAWYFADEITTAVALHRAAPAEHLIIPVRIDPAAALPYGLNHVQAIDAASAGGIAGVAARVRALIERADEPT